MSALDWMWVILFVVVGLPILVMWDGFIQKERRRRRRVTVTKVCRPALRHPRPPPPAA